MLEEVRLQNLLVHTQGASGVAEIVQGWTTGLGPGPDCMRMGSQLLGLFHPEYPPLGNRDVDLGDL